MGTLGLCEIVYMRLVYIEQVWSVERKKEYRTGDLFLISATTVPARSNSWKEIFVWVQPIQKGRFWWDRTVYFMAAREPKSGMLVSPWSSSCLLFPFYSVWPHPRA